MTLDSEYPCPCCGYLVFAQPPGMHKVCPICRWEDDLAQLRFPTMPGSANRVSLHDAQHNFAEFGAVDRFHEADARKPALSDRREEGWRQLNVETDNIEHPQRGQGNVVLNNCHQQAAAVGGLFKSGDRHNVNIVLRKFLYLIAGILEIKVS